MAAARSTATKAAVLAVMSGVAIALTPSPGWAKDGLTSADPADGAALQAPPAWVDLTFSGTPDVERSHVSVRDARGAQVVVGAFVGRDATTLRQPVSITGTGDFTVADHVELIDGRETVGSLRFSVGTGMSPAVPGEAAPLADEAAVSGHDHGIDPVGGVLLALDFAVVLIVGVLLLRRQEPRPSAGTPTPESRGHSRRRLKRGQTFATSQK